MHRMGVLYSFEFPWYAFLTRSTTVMQQRKACQVIKDIDIFATSTDGKLRYPSNTTSR